jgi:hypothetical protein
MNLKEKKPKMIWEKKKGKQKVWPSWLGELKTTQMIDQKNGFALKNSRWQFFLILRHDILDQFEFHNLTRQTRNFNHGLQWIL